jgi:GGDEF domain-containing protein
VKQESRAVARGLAPGIFIGSEYVVLVSDVAQKDAFKLLDGFRNKVSQMKLRFDEEVKGMSVSIGLSISDSDSLTDLLHRCGDLLQRAQQARQDIVLYD